MSEASATCTATSRSSPRSRKVSFPTADGWQLAGTLFEPAATGGRGAGRAVLIGSGIGIHRGFYQRFARRLATHGLTALSLDWRGTGDSAAVNGDRPARLVDWGAEDLPAAVDWLEAEVGAGSLAYVGHSIAGAILGLTPSVERFDRLLLVTVGSGYYHHWDGLSRPLIRLIWRVGIPAVTRVLGRLPGWTLGGRYDVPTPAAMDWARWGRNPSHVLSESPEVRRRFAELEAPVRVYAVTDDWFAPPRAAETVMSYFESAALDRVWLRPEEMGVRRIGHFGFFRPEMAETLWTDAARWLSETRS